MKNLHSWNVSYGQARTLQQKLASKVQFIPISQPIRLIAGLDCSFSKDGSRIFAAVVVFKADTHLESPWKPQKRAINFELIETQTTSLALAFPYIPGLLSFREAPACIAVVGKLKTKPDLFIIDGQGIAHPRRLGLAAHLGLFFDKPTIGCAKSRLTGTFKEPKVEKGSYCPLIDKKDNQIIGAVLRTRKNVKPLFVSVGNKCTLEDATAITLACATKYRLPEPTRLAHKTVSEAKLK